MSTSNNSALFYQSLAHAVDTAEGDLFLNLNPGRWRTVFSGKIYTWVIPANSLVEVTFKYGGGVLVHATALFTPPVDLVLPDNAGTITITAISWNQLGDVVGLEFTPAPAGMDEDAITKAQRIISMRCEPHQLFLGVPLVGFASVTPVDATGQPTAGASSIVQRVRFEKSEDLPGLKVTFKDHAVIKFSDSGLVGSPFNNFVSVRAGSGVNFDEIDYTVDESYLLGTVSNFSVLADEGLFTSTGLILRIATGSQLRFDNIAFERTQQGDVSIDGTFGSLSAAVGGGSQLVLSSGASFATDSVTFDDNSHIDLAGFKLQIKNSASRVEISGGSSLDVKVHAGRFTVGDNGYLGFQNGTLQGNFQGTWDSVTGIDAKVDVQLLTVTGVGGEIDFNADTRLGFTDGILDSTSLSIKTGKKLTGTFDRLSLNIGENSAVGFGNGIQLNSAAGGSFVGATPGNPLQFNAAMKYPVGGLSLVLPFKRLFNAKSPAFSLQNGISHLNIRSFGDGSATGSNCDFSGSAVLVAQGLAINPSVSLANVSFDLSDSGDFHLAGKLAVSLKAGSSLNVVTPFVKGIPDHDDFRWFPLTLAASVADDLIVSDAPFTIDNGVVNLGKITLNPAIKVQIPPGLGEHQDADDANSADGTNGPDEDKLRQEAVQDKFVHGTITVHLYLVAATYDFQSALNISITDNILDIEVTNFQLAQNQAVGFDRDGGNLGIFGTLFGAIIGAILHLPGGSITGAVIGHFAGDKLDDRVNDQIAGGIAQAIVDRRFSWHTQI